MPLHEKDSVRDRLNDDVYGSADLAVSMPKYKMPDVEHDPRHAYSVVHDELMLDGNSRQNLATFCQTWAEPEVHTLMDECMDKNMIDKDEYPQCAEIESRCVHMLADLWNSPAAANTLGCSTTGSSEAAMLSGMAMKWRWRAKQKAAGKSIDRPNMICGPVQICWHKFARYWDIELREIPMEEGRLIMSPAEVLKRCDENTIGVVPTLGVTFTCQYEPVTAVAGALDKLQAETGLDIPMHVDGASGGFLAPFCAPTWCGTFALSESSRSTVPATSLVWRRWGLAGWSGAKTGSSGGPGFSRQLSRWRYDRLRTQLFATRWFDRCAILQFSSSGQGRLSQNPYRMLRNGGVPGPRNQRAGAV